VNVLGLYLLGGVRTGGNKDYIDILEGLSSRGIKVLVLCSAAFDYRASFFSRLDLPIRRRWKFMPLSCLFKKGLKKHFTSISGKLAAFYGGRIDYIVNFGDTHLKAALYLKKKTGAALLHGFRAGDVDRGRILRKAGDMRPGEYALSFLFEGINRSREKQAAKHARCLTFLNQSDRESFLRRTRCYGAKTAVIPNHIGPPGCPDEYKNKNRPVSLKQILYAGTVSSSKGLWDLLRAAALLKSRGHGDLRYYLLGRLENTGPTMELVRKLDIADQLAFEGYQNPFPYLVRCALFVYPTLYDSFGKVITEALHAGCPVIASSAAGPLEILRYPELLFKPGNYAEIADRIERCLTDGDFYQRVRSLCAERASHYYFDWAARYESFLQDHLPPP
jgi:glycosyltransferase involved in cell wall biosynthesis